MTRKHKTPTDSAPRTARPGPRRRKPAQTATARYFDLFDQAPAGYLTLDEPGLILEANHAAARLLGRAPDALVAQPLSHFIHPEDQEIFRQLRTRLGASDQTQTCELRIRLGEGPPSWVQLAASGAPGCRIVLTDRTGPNRDKAILDARSRLLTFAQTHTQAELLRATLDEAEALVGSCIGFCHFLQADQQTLSLQAWSTNTLQKMCQAVGAGQHYPVQQAGVWADCVRERRAVIHNDYAHLPHRKGMPPGHAPVLRQLAVPVLRDGLIVSILGVGNKPTDYTEEDIQAVWSLADLAWDLVERKRSEEALRASEERYHRIAGAITDYIYSVRVADGRAVATTHGPGCEAITGYGPEAFAADPDLWLRMVVAADRPRVEDQARRIMAGEDPPPLEHRITLQNGTTRWVRNTFVPRRDERGALTAYDGLIQDITARKQAETALQVSETKYRELAEGLKDVLWTLDPQTLRFLYVSPSVQRLRGFTPEEIIAQPINAALSAAAADDLKALIRQRTEAFQSGPEAAGPFYTDEVEQPCKDGTTVWTEVVTRYVRNETTGQVEVRGVTRDLAERKRAEAARESLATKNRQLHKAESLSRMAGAIAHHFNNQLQVVMGNLEMALQELPRKAGPVANLTAAMQSTHTAARMSTLMLTYLGESQGKREPLDLAATCLGTLSLLRTVMPRRVSLVADLSVPGPSIRADALQIQQVLTNLATNAWEASGDGAARLRLAVRTVAATEISAVNRFPLDWQPPAPAYACLEMADEGRGIAAQEIENLFDPFFSSKFLGRGLGLPVVLGIARAHDGGVTVASEPGRGTVFRVFLPLAGTREAPPVTSADPHPAGAGAIPAP